MTRQPVTSSSIKSVGHDGQHAEVEFHNGKIYHLTDMPAAEFERLLGAESIGRHFNEFVRGKYPHRLVEQSADENGPRED